MSFEEKPDQSEQEFWQLVDLLKSEDIDVRRNAADALGNLGDPRAVEPLVASLTAEVSNIASGRALVKFGEPALFALLDKLNSDENLLLGNVVINVLGVMQDERTIEPLIKIAKNVEHQLRTMSISALSLYNNSRYINGSKINRLFIELMQNDPSPQVRRAAATKLGEKWAKNLEAVDPLIAILDDQDEYLVGDAVHSLGQIGDTKAIDPLIALLKHKSPRIRQRTASAIGNLRDAKAVDPLINALKDDDIYTRQNAIMALGCIGDKRAVKPLLEILKHYYNIRITGFVIEALGVLADPEALPALQKIRQRDLGIATGVLGTPIREVALIAIERIQQRMAGSTEPFEFYIR